MKKMIILLIWLVGISSVYAQVENDNVSAGTVIKKKVNVHGMILLTHNAFAPIPAFSFDDPALMAFLSVGSKRFKYEPDFSIGLNGRPWMWNNWFRYTCEDRQKFKLAVAVNPSLFFISTKTEGAEDLLEAHRNLTGEVMATFQPAAKQKYMLTYRYNEAFDFGTINGHFIDLAAEFQKVLEYKNLTVTLRPQLFYFNNQGSVDGLFVGNTVQLGHSKFPFLLAYQSVQSIWTNFLPEAAYRHSISFIFLF